MEELSLKKFDQLRMLLLHSVHKTLKAIPLFEGTISQKTEFHLLLVNK